MFDKLKRWYYKKCLKKYLNKMEDFKNDPDYYLCVDGSKECIEIQKTQNRIFFYQFILSGKCDRELLSIWLKRNYPFEYWSGLEKVEGCPKR